jgi:hypothetical protein
MINDNFLKNETSSDFESILNIDTNDTNINKEILSIDDNIKNTLYDDNESNINDKKVIKSVSMYKNNEK